MSIFAMKKHLKDVFDSILSTPNKFSLLVSELHGKSIKVNYGGVIAWYYNGVLHREGGPAYIEGDYHKEWWYKGKLHRENGPAIEDSGLEEWYLYGNKFYEKIVCDSGRVIETYYDEQGNLHNDIGPSRISSCGCEEWYKHGIPHRDDDKPAYTTCSNHGGSRKWFVDGEVHRENGPAIISEIDKKDKGIYHYQEKWIRNGVEHRDSGPACIEIFKTSRKIDRKKTEVFKKEVIWLKDGVIHREDGPAYISYLNGLIEYEEYSLRGMLHNSVGPAQIWYKNQYSREDPHVEFYINDNRVNLEAFTKRLERRMGIPHVIQRTETTNNRSA